MKTSPIVNTPAACGYSAEALGHFVCNVHSQAINSIHGDCVSYLGSESWSWQNCCSSWDQESWQVDTLQHECVVGKNMEYLYPVLNEWIVCAPMELLHKFKYYRCTLLTCNKSLQIGYVILSIKHYVIACTSIGNQTYICSGTNNSLISPEIPSFIWYAYYVHFCDFCLSLHCKQKHYTSVVHKLTLTTPLMYSLSK